MLKGISWSGYFQMVSWVAVLYYAAVVAMYFRKEMAHYWSRLMGVRSGDAFRHHGDFAGGLERPAERPPKIIEELQLFFLSAREQKFQKEEIFMALELLLKSKQPLNGGEHVEIIKRFMVSQLQSVCHIRVEERDIEYMFRN